MYIDLNLYKLYLIDYNILYELKNIEKSIIFYFINLIHIMNYKILKNLFK